MHVAAFAQGEHLVDLDVRDPARSLLQRVDNRYRLAVSEPDDEVSTFTEVVEHVLGHGTFLGERGRYARRVARCQVLHIPSHLVRTTSGGHVTGWARAAKPKRRRASVIRTARQDRC